MPSPLRTDDIPRRLPAQLAQLADGRLLVRCREGLRLLGGLEFTTVESILDQIDGQQTVEQICDQLAPHFATEDLHRWMCSLTGILLDFNATAPSAEPEARTKTPTTAAESTPDTGALILGDGALAHSVADLMTAPLLGLDNHLWLDQINALETDSAGLVICALEEASYATLFDIQRACVRARRASLFVTADPDGVRIGPLTVPGEGPCFACAQVASLRSSKTKPDELLTAISTFRTGRAPHAAIELLAREVAAEARAGFALADSRPGPKPRLLTAVDLFGVNFLGINGRRTHYGVTPVAGCRVCQPVELEAPSDAGSEHPLAANVRRELFETYRRTPRLATPPADASLCTRIGIVGGGTAGYLTAMALRRKLPHLDITLIESSSLPIIGVGEATTPLMPQFLHVDLGLDIVEFFHQVEPTLKLGIRFEWGTPEGCFNYPFGPVHVLEPTIYDGDLLQCSPQSMLMTAGTIGINERSHAPSHLDVDVAYHLDNQPFVQFLRRKAADFGITTLDARIVDVALDADGESVAHLVTDDGRHLDFDLYIDCSGFRSLLIEKALRSPFRGYDKSLFADCALAASVPNQGIAQPYTRAQTLNAGWCWSTPQRHEDHRGYVFSSNFLSPEDAEREMRRMNPDMGDARLIPFRTGRHEHFWKGNVVAMGNAYGFVEPLESTALHMLIRQIGLLLSAFPLRRNERGLATLLNRKVGAFWDYLGWFLALHYRFNRRLDTPFWRHCHQAVDVSHHGELLTAFQERGPLSYNPSLLRNFDVPDPLWGAEGIDLLLMGQHVPTTLPQPRLNRAEWQQRTRLYRDVTRRMLPQAQALEFIDQRPELLRQWVAAFQRVGPAFEYH